MYTLFLSVYVCSLDLTYWYRNGGYLVGWKLKGKLCLRKLGSGHCVLPSRSSAKLNYFVHWQLKINILRQFTFGKKNHIYIYNLRMSLHLFYSLTTLTVSFQGPMPGK